MLTGCSLFKAEGRGKSLGEIVQGDPFFQVAPNPCRCSIEFIDLLRRFAKDDSHIIQNEEAHVFGKAAGRGRHLVIH